MESKIQKQIIDYFSFFEEFYNASKTCLKDCQRIVSDINNYIDKCRIIGQTSLEETPLAKFEDLTNKLVSKLHNLISVEVQELQDHSSKLESSFDQLYQKNKTLLTLCKELDVTQETPLIKGTPFQPSLETLLSYANDTLTVGGHICAIFECSLRAITVQGTKKTLPVTNFKIPRPLEATADEVITYTSFCSCNTI